MKLKGSFTVEASLVMPVVILTVISVSLLAMGLRDRVYSTAWVRRQAAVQAADGAAGAADEAMQLLVSDADLSVTETGAGGRSVSCAGSAGRIWPGGTVSYSDGAETQILDQPAFLYRCRLAQEILGRD